MRVLRQIITILAALLFTLLIMVVLLQIGSRYGARFFPGMPIVPWTEELSRFLFVAMVSLGSILVMHSDGFARVELFSDFMKKKGRVWTLSYELIIAVILLLFYAFFIYGAYEFFLIGFRSTSPTMGISFGLVYAVILLMGLLTSVEICIRIVSLVRSLAAAPMAVNLGIKRKERE